MTCGARASGLHDEPLAQLLLDLARRARRNAPGVSEQRFERHSGTTVAYNPAPGKLRSACLLGRAGYNGPAQGLTEGCLATPRLRKPCGGDKPMRFTLEIALLAAVLTAAIYVPVSLEAKLQYWIWLGSNQPVHLRLLRAG